jgi:hypothetical protein
MDPKPFPLQIDSFLGTASGGHHRHHGPRASRRLFGGVGHAPVVAVLLASAKAGRRVHRCPQRGRNPDPRHFCLQNAHFLGATEGGSHADGGPLRAAPSAPRSSWPGARWWARVMPPLGRYFARQAKARRAHLRTQRSAIHAPPMFCLTMRLAAIRRAERCDARPVVTCRRRPCPRLTCRRRPCPRLGSTSRA